MTGEQSSARKAVADRKNQHGNGHRNMVWDLVSAYGPDVTSLCHAGTALIPAIAGIGLSAGPPGSEPRIRFSSDTASSRLETAQLTLDEGPCRDATTMRRPILATDLASGSWRQRWPRFTPAALDAGARAVFALPLHAGGVHHDGAVDLYRNTPGPLNSADQMAAATFTAATAELLTLERHDLNLTDVFTHGWRSIRSENTAGAARTITPTTTPDAADNVLLACWFGAAMLGPVREQIRTLAIQQGLRGNHTHRLVLAVHEAVTNAVDHGGGHGQLLLWRRDGRLWCEISDHGPGIPAGGPTDDRAAASHRNLGWSGLTIIRRSCPSMDIITDPTGTRLLLSYQLGRRPPR
ncbi:ATP-binding protein [Actinoplanes sp. NBC_00393]|uniref:ATP-binding protein n=1 Tax=Actinoplanes sp. NBC_00393 TaxID=2975953 RepID=UPI002E1EE709